MSGNDVRAVATRPATDGPSGKSSVVELIGVSRWYGNVVAVNDVTMTLGPGVTGLLGPNGAGKTTLLHMMSGFLASSRGTVTVDGAPVWRRPAVYGRLGLVSEREAVHGFLSGYEFVLASARLHRLPDPRAAARRAIELVDMTEPQHRRIGTYSKGMRQRIRVAAALVHDPAVLLLDEPFNGMDPRQRLHMMQVLHQLGETGRTVLFSSHILEEVAQLSGTVQVIVAGRLAASGDYRTIRRLMTHRPHVFTVHSSDNRRLAVALLAKVPVVSGVELAPIGDGAGSGANGPGHRSAAGAAGTFEGLTVRTSDYGAFTRALASVAVAEGVRITRLLPTDESLESVFSYLVAS